MNKKLRNMLIIIVLLFLIGPFVPRWITLLHARGKTYPVETAPARDVAVVFGAGLRRDGSPTPVLRDRVQTAAELYFSGKVKKVLMSGDNRFVDYNEPGSMKEYALQLGIPEEDIVLDYAGRRTYDTCYRARDIFQVDDVLLVTQEFHLPRAIYTCQMLGVQAVGAIADQRAYSEGSLRFWKLREIPAAFVAFLQVHVTRPEPVLGEAEPIFPDRARK